MMNKKTCLHIFNGQLLSSLVKCYRKGVRKCHFAVKVLFKQKSQNYYYRSSNLVLQAVNDIFFFNIFLQCVSEYNVETKIDFCTDFQKYIKNNFYTTLYFTCLYRESSLFVKCMHNIFAIIPFFPRRRPPTHHLIQ